MKKFREFIKLDKFPLIVNKQGKIKYLGQSQAKAEEFIQKLLDEEEAKEEEKKEENEEK